MVVSTSVVTEVVTVWLTGNCGSLPLPSIMREGHIAYQDPGEGQTSEFKVWFLLNVYCFVLPQSQTIISHTILSWELSVQFSNIYEDISSLLVIYIANIFYLGFPFYSLKGVF